MIELKNKTVLVVGLGVSGRAAGALLARRGVRVTVVDGADNPALRAAAAALESLGVEVLLGCAVPPDRHFDLVVVSPGVPGEQRLVRDLVRREVPVIGELELGYQQSRCLCLGITGTNGKTTTTELVERVLLHCQRKTVAAGNIGRPLCEVADQSQELDFLTLEVSSFQLETTQFFRPVVAVLLNLTPDHLDRYAGMDDYIRAKARIFTNQQSFDWAIIQSEALARLQALRVAIPAKIITFSASNRNADIYLDRTLILSRIEGWAGVLLDMNQVQLRGPHNAENLMATLAVSRVLRLPLNEVAESLKTYQPAPHRCELVGEVNGVQFVNDSKATNVDAVQKAILAMPPGAANAPNVWLIAGGKDKGFDYHEIGPLLSQRVKGAVLIGETREKIRAAWALFTRCQLAESLNDAVQLTAKQAVAGDIVLLSPACSSFDQFRNYQHRGEVFRKAVAELVNTTDCGCKSRQAQHNETAIKNMDPKSAKPK